MDQEEDSQKWSIVERKECHGKRTFVDRHDCSHNMRRREDRHHKRISSNRSYKRSSKNWDECTHKQHKQ